MPETKNVPKQLEKGNNYREISGNFGAVCEKVNTTGTDENLFRVVSVQGTDVSDHGPILVPEHGAQARAPSLNGALVGSDYNPIIIISNNLRGLFDLIMVFNLLMMASNWRLNETKVLISS